MIGNIWETELGFEKLNAKFIIISPEFWEGLQITYASEIFTKVCQHDHHLSVPGPLNLSCFFRKTLGFIQAFKDILQKYL